MNAARLIARKRDGEELSADEIRYFVDGFANGNIPDYQMSAMAMAIFCRGMNIQETTYLTAAMLETGMTCNWPADWTMVDKHSTGGVGDKVSIILAPLLACCDVRVPMISGRGLGPTGGTLDKLESIPGFQTQLSVDRFKACIKQVGCVISGATEEIAPADRRLYALRDVTATVASMPLITSSILSKKLAEGLDVLVLDVKFGNGAFMKHRDQARELAKCLVEVGRRLGVSTTALLTDMNQPLGRMVGNANEVDESIETLQGGGPDDLRQLTFALAEKTLLDGGITTSATAAKQIVTDAIASGKAHEKFAQMVTAQGGHLPAKLSREAPHVIQAHRDGIVSSINTEQLGWAVIEMGGGRRVASDKIDPSVGLEMLVRIGDEIQSDQPLATVFAPTAARDRAESMVRSAIRLGDAPAAPPQLIAETIG